MKIQLDSEYFLLGDVHQWILFRKTPKCKFIPEGYFSDLAILLKSYINLKSRIDNNITTIQELINFQNSLLSNLNESLSPLQIKIVSLKEVVK